MLQINQETRAHGLKHFKRFVLSEEAKPQIHDCTHMYLNAAIDYLCLRVTPKGHTLTKLIQNSRMGRALASVVDISKLSLTIQDPEGHDM